MSGFVPHLVTIIIFLTLGRYVPEGVLKLSTDLSVRAVRVWQAVTKNTVLRLVGSKFISCPQNSAFLYTSRCSEITVQRIAIASDINNSLKILLLLSGQ